VFVVRVKALNTHKTIIKNKFAKVFIVRGKYEKIDVNKLSAEDTLKDIVKNTVKESGSRPQR
jgi:hypothetical protein